MKKGEYKHVSMAVKKIHDENQKKTVDSYRKKNKSY